MPAGYSSTPLSKKIGLKENQIFLVINKPKNYETLFETLPTKPTTKNNPKILKDIIHFFTKENKELTENLPFLKQQIKQNGIIWVSWPKKSAKVSTDITEDKIRNFALQIGLVDVKVCAIDETWSALKLVIPVSLRNAEIYSP